MKNEEAIEKWGKYIVTVKRADELEIGDRILLTLPRVWYTFPYTIGNIKIKKSPLWIVTVTFHSCYGEGEPVDFKRTYATNQIFPVIVEDGYASRIC